MTNFVLHAGLPKTATTTLQQTLFTLHPEVYFLGKNTAFGAAKGCRSAELERLLTPAIWQTSQPFDPGSLRAAVDAGVWSAMAERKVVLGSWEALATMAGPERFGEMLRRLARLFGGCRLMVSVRNPYTWIPSLYLQELQGSFVRRNRADLCHRPFHELDDWFRRKDRPNKGNRLFCFGDNIRQAVEVLGRDNVTVLVYEDLVADPGDYFANLCEFLGVDAEAGLELAARKRFNTRLTQAQVEAMRHADASPLRRLAWRLASDRQRGRRLRQVARAAGEADRPAVVELSGDIRREVAERSRDTYRWLAGEFALPLARHGYPV
jgi:hypothetical protein